MEPRKKLTKQLEKSIFTRYYSREKFVDRFKKQKKDAVDIIIPLMNTNELWETNLHCFYREIPINRLIIGDGGCIDDSIKIVRKFPRVKIIKQSHCKSLGYCIKELIENVETEWFIYLHADVYLPTGWFDTMKKYKNKYDWYECYRKITAMMEFWSESQNKGKRALSGSQMGRTAIFKEILPVIKDDYLQRYEDLIFAELVKSTGFKYGKVSDAFHYHQAMNKRGESEPKFSNIIMEKEPNKDWERRMKNMDARGIIKYLNPKPYLIPVINATLFKLKLAGGLDWHEFKQWVKKTNPAWLEHIRVGTWGQRLMHIEQRLIFFGIKMYKIFKKQ